MMGVDVDDQHVVETARMRLFARVRQEPAGVELLDGDAATAIGNEIHGISPGVLSIGVRPFSVLPFSLIPAQAGIQKVLNLGPCLRGDERIMIHHRPVQLCHMPSSKTARSAARSNPLAVSITSVAEIECFGTGVNCSPASVRAL